MSGNAIKPLLDKLQQHPNNKARKLYIGKIVDEELDNVLPNRFGVFPKDSDQTYIGRLLAFLAKKGLINTDYVPKFSLGSTRLAALKNYGKDAVSTDKLETDDIIDIASGRKSEFGDLDIDVILSAPRKQVIQAINAFETDTFIATETNDINVAIRLSDKVIQIDLVDIKKNQQSITFLKKSGFLDLASNVKGVFSIYLLRAVVKNMKISPTETLNAVLDFANKNPSSSFSISLQKKIQNGFNPVKVRFSLGEQGLKLVLELKKENKVEKLDIDLDPRSDYKNLDLLAQQILQEPTATSSDIFHALSLAKFLRQYKPNEVETIWQDFTVLAQKHIKPSIDEKDYNIGLKEVEKMLGITRKTTIKEGREAIGRFEGKNEFSNPEMFELLYQLVSQTKNEGRERFSIDLQNSPVVDMTEKTDAMFCNFGIDRNGKFFMQSSNSGPVYETNFKEKFSFSSDLLASFDYLNNNKQFQNSLKKLSKSIGSFKFDAELFPVLTHKGNENGDVIFVGTKYKKEKLGRQGAFVIFKTWLWNDTNLSWYRPEIEQNIRSITLMKHEAESSSWNKDWKILTNETDMKISGTLNINVGRYLAAYLDGAHMFERGMNALKSRSKTSEKETLILELHKIRNELQAALDDFANVSKSVLGDARSFIEGVVLRIKTADGDIYEVKGTSEAHNLQKELLWHDRTQIISLENDFEDKFIKNVLGLKTSQPASLNRIISAAVDEYLNTNGKRNKVDFIHFLIPHLVENDIDFDLTKSNALTLLEETEKIYQTLLTNFEMNEGSIDTDSSRKTREYFEAFKNKYTTYKNLVRSNLNGSEYYVKVLDAVLGFRIEKFFNTSYQESPADQKREKVILWSGRAQPWHKGHHAMIMKGKTMLEKLGASKILIMIIKGAESSKNLDQNPLNEKEQVALLYSLYKNDPQIEIHNKFPKTGAILELLEHVHDKGYVVSGWLAGSDRIIDYRKSILSYKPQLFLDKHDYSPIQMNHDGTPLFSMIEAPRIMSGTDVRQMAKSQDFKTWLQSIAPENTDNSAMRVYKTIYDIIRGEKSTTLNETKDDTSQEITEEMIDEVFDSLVEDEINEISAMGAGAIQGFGAKTMDRENFLEEMKLRKYIKETLKEHFKAKKVKNLQTLKEEVKLRSHIRSLLKEAEEDRPHHSTGINVLSDLLKKIVPVIEIDYKKITSNPAQRQSFRAHIIKASTNLLATEQQNDKADDESEVSDSIEQASDTGDVEISLEEADDEVELDPEMEKFIDIEKSSQKKVKKPKEKPEDTFTIQGEDMTGRNLAMSTFDKIETSISDAYGILSDDEDKRLFYDYLVVNFKLYFDRWDSALKSQVAEPASDLYDKEKNNQGDELDPSV